MPEEEEYYGLDTAVSPTIVVLQLVGCWGHPRVKAVDQDKQGQMMK